MHNFLKTLTLILSVLLALTFVSCGATSSSFERTGKTYAPLAKSTYVDVIMSGIPKYKVEQIGIVTIEFGTEGEQITEAKKIALENGADVVILKDLKRRMLTDSDGIPEELEIRTFEIAKKIK